MSREAIFCLGCVCWVYESDPQQPGVGLPPVGQVGRLLRSEPDTKSGRLRLTPARPPSSRRLLFHFAMPSRDDAKHSTGIPTGLTGEKLAVMTAMAAKAEASFPPPPSGVPYKGPVCTPDGDKALELGRWANAHRGKAPKDSGSTGAIAPGFPTREELTAELGGVEGFFTLMGLHYVQFFANPRMNVLIDSTHAESAVSAMEHGKRNGATLLDLWFHTSYFSSLGRGFSGAFAVMGTHSRAKKCPMRPESEQVAMPKGHPKANRRFTTDQRDTWVGQIMVACELCQTSPEFQKKLGTWLAMTVSAYAPFVDERTGKLDWMEESPYG